MSILPLTGLIGIGLSFYLIPVSIVDTQYTNVDGNDVQSIVESRTIQAAVDPSNSRQLENIFGGNVSDGDIGIYTQDTLYIDDQYDTGSRGKQSYITFQNFKYRVVNVADWAAQAGMKVYLAKRHVKQDIV